MSKYYLLVFLRIGILFAKWHNDELTLYTCKIKRNVTKR